MTRLPLLSLPVLPVLPVFFIVVAAVLLGTASEAHAQPSLEVRADQSSPWLEWGLSIDVLGPIWSEYTLTGHAMPSRFVGARVTLGYQESEILLAKIAADFRPMGQSFDGVLLSIGLEYRTTFEVSRHLLGLFAEAGYTLVWRNLLLSAAAGVSFLDEFEEQTRVRVTPTIRLSVGWVM